MNATHQQKALLVDELGRFCAIASRTAGVMADISGEKQHVACRKAIVAAHTKAKDLRDRLTTEPLFHAESGPHPSD